jgi:signal transduction protein with GAF and PtsI domain
MVAGATRSQSRMTTRRLARTELQFMVAERMPSRAEQTALYAAVFEAAGDQPVTFRRFRRGP